MLLSNPGGPERNHLHTTQSMRPGICGKAMSAARFSISWAKSLSKVRICHTLNSSFLQTNNELNRSYVRMKSYFLDSSQRRGAGWHPASSFVIFSFFTLLWFNGRAEHSDSCLLHSRMDWASQSNSKTHTHTQPNNRLFLWQRFADAAVFMIRLLPPLIPMLHPQWIAKKKNPLFNQQWQSLTQIASRRLRGGGMARFTEAMGIHEKEASFRPDWLPLCSRTLPLRLLTEPRLRPCTWRSGSKDTRRWW